MSLGGESVGPSGDVAAADLPISTGGGLSYEPGSGISFAVNPNAPSMPDITYAAQQALIGGVLPYEPGSGISFAVNPNAPSMPDITYAAQQAPSMPDITDEAQWIKHPQTWTPAQQALMGGVLSGSTSMGGVPSGSTSMGGAYYSTPQATSASPVAAGRLTDPTFVAQQALLKGAANAAKDRPQYQPLLTPDNYKDFYKDQPYADTSPAQRAVPNYLLEPSAEADEAAAHNSEMAGGGGGSFDDAPSDSEWSGLTDTEKAAWYAENPTWGAIARAGNKAFSYSPYSLMQEYFTPGTAIRSDAIAAGIDPTGWEFGTRNSDGLFGTTIGGTISYDFSPENMSMYAFPSGDTSGTEAGNTGMSDADYGGGLI